MRFSIVAGPRQRADLGETAAQAMHNFADDAVLAEELGYDAIYFGEHHFCFASGNSSPLLMLTNVAARTKRIRVGMSVICAPFHNPLRLAEDIAAVDILSNGRLDLGIGVGSQWEEFQTFGIDPKERFGRTWEIIDIIEKCLYSPVNETFDWKGKYYNFPGIRWIMQPVQKRIPIFWGGFGPQGVQRAAERGYHLIAFDFSGTYQRVMAQHGRNPKDYLIGFANIVSIADTKEKALAAMAEPSAWVSNQYATRPDLEGKIADVRPYTPADIVAAAEAGLQGKFAPDVPFSVPAAGTVQEIIDHFLPIMRGERGLITHLVVSVREPGTKTEDAHRSMRLFATGVMPALKEEAAKHGV